MKEFWNIVQTGFCIVGGWLGYFLGGYDGLIIRERIEHDGRRWFVYITEKGEELYLQNRDAAGYDYRTVQDKVNEIVKK